MTTITQVPRDIVTGALMPSSRRTTIYDIDFTTLAAIPSTVTISGAGSGAMTGTAPYAALRLSTTSSIDSLANAALPAIDASLWQWLMFTVELTVPATNATTRGELSLGGLASTGGAKWNNFFSGVLNSRNGDTDLRVGSYVVPQGRVTRCSAGLLVIPSRKIAAAIDANEGTYGVAYLPNMLGGSLEPTLSTRAQTAGVKTLDVRRMTLVGAPA